MTIFLGKGGAKKNSQAPVGGTNFFSPSVKGGTKKIDAFSEKFCRPPPHLINERSLTRGRIVFKLNLKVKQQ